MPFRVSSMRNTKNNMNTKTPLTDEQCRLSTSIDGNNIVDESSFVTVKFAREIEERMHAAEAKLNEIKKIINGQQ